MFVCDSCGTVWNHGGIQCLGCGERWCDWCDRKRVTKFTYGNREACTGCWDKEECYQCKLCPQGMCPSEHCWLITTNFIRIGRSTIYRGVCCRARGYTDTLCINCAKWETQKACIIMIGARKFRKNNLLNTLPRDVLIYALLKPFVWPEKSGKRPNFKELKKLKA
jgi:hypothetical protein